MRLTTSVKDQIIQNAVCKSGLAEKKELISVEITSVAVKINDHNVSKHITKSELDRLIKMEKELTDLTPDYLIESRVINKENYVRFHMAGERRCLSLPSFSITSATYFDLPVDHKLAIKLVSLERGITKVKGEINDLKVAVRQTLNSVTTVNKLIKVWPESKELIPDSLDSPSTQLTVPVANLNKLIGLPSGE